MYILLEARKAHSMASAPFLFQHPGTPTLDRVPPRRHTTWGGARRLLCGPFHAHLGRSLRIPQGDHDMRYRVRSFETFLGTRKWQVLDSQGAIHGNYVYWELAIKRANRLAGGTP